MAHVSTPCCAINYGANNYAIFVFPTLSVSCASHPIKELQKRTSTLLILGCMHMIKLPAFYDPRFFCLGVDKWH